MADGLGRNLGKTRLIQDGGDCKCGEEFVRSGGQMQFFEPLDFCRLMMIQMCLSKI